MLKSMTGYGRSDIQNGDHTCRVEIRSVNNRFIEINARLPKMMLPLEVPLKKLIKSRCSRGSFDVSVSLEKTNGNTADQVITPNMALASQYLQVLNQIKDQLGLAGEIDLNSVLALRDVVKIEPLTVDSSKEELVLETVETALSALLKMRADEGKNLQPDILGRIECIEKFSGFIKSKQPEIILEYKNRLKEKIQLLSDGVEVDETRLAQETAIMADRCDVTEEVVRLESHLDQFKKLIESDGPMGRKLEFITQEINREVNTIGSKTVDARVSQSVIEIKSDLEKIREQLQNIE